MMRSPILALLALATLTSVVTAQAPDSISFQGKLTDTNGNPINQNGLSMTFRMYKNLSIIWTETQSVDVVDGVFNVYLGKVAALDTVAFDEPITLGVKVQGQATEISPRTPLVMAAYAKALPGLYTFYREAGSVKSQNVVGGASHNVVAPNVSGATIGGGGGFLTIVPHPNQVLDDFGTVSGGRGNTASGFEATVGGGGGNSASDNYATVSGGSGNKASDRSTTVAGGSGNDASGWASTIGGGVLNEATMQYSVVPGGYLNVAGGLASFAAGYKAEANHTGTFVWNDYLDLDSFESTAGNQFLIHAAGGVGINTNAPKQQLHVNGDYYGRGHLYLYSFDGDGSSGVAYIQGRDDSGTSSIDLQLRTQNAGGITEAMRLTSGGKVGIGTASPGATLHINSVASPSVPQLSVVGVGGLRKYGRIRIGNTESFYWEIAAGDLVNDVLNFYTPRGRGNVLSLRSSGDPLRAYNGAVLTEAGEWKNVSSVERKTDFEDLEVRDVLDKLAVMPINQWRYKVESEAVRHIGPMAEDFHEVFGLGEGSDTIGTVDAAGVALAAIQGLYELVKEQQAVLSNQQVEIDRLRELMAGSH